MIYTSINLIVYKCNAQWHTIAEDNQHNEVDGRHDAVALNTATGRSNPIVHYGIPILASYDLTHVELRDSLENCLRHENANVSE